MRRNKCRIALFGSGYFGSIHAKNLLSTDFEFVGYYDPERELNTTTAVERFDDPEKLIESVDAVDVVTATSSHMEIAALALKMNKHIFVEKPLAGSAEEAEEFMKLARKKDVVIQVGHIERFNPAFHASTTRVEQARFIQSKRLAPYNSRANDVSVVHDLMIHDIDAILSLVRSRVRNIYASGFSILTDHLDHCEARIEFENGCIANLQASRVHTGEQVREMIILGDFEEHRIDFLNKSCTTFHLIESEDKVSDKWLTPRGRFDIKKNNIIFSSSNAILDQLNEFYKSITNGEPIRVSHDDAFLALSVADKVNKLAQ